LGMAALLASIGEPGRVAAFVEQRLGVLVEYDRTNRRQLVATLGAYLDHAGSIERAARALGIHPSTMKYRMGRVRELVDADLTDPDVRFELQFATRAAAVLEAAGPERSGR
ncbi:MAG: helix-turn-helix domain-containing protein, partial [Actinomycetota bacterium]|nr:helix-turn-helix domain-containing protein [Actinomycetota bacterium]